LGVIVTGASRGIGHAIADGFASEGANISICARGAETLETAREALSRHGTLVHAAVCDVSDTDALAAYTAEAGETLGRVNVLVNNPTGAGEGDEDDTWRRNFDIDLMAAVHAVRLAVPMMSAAGQGSIVNISSVSGLMPAPQNPSYAAIKAAIMQLTTSQAKKLAADNIRVNCIAPGSTMFKGGFWDRMRANNPGHYHATIDSIPFGRLGTVEEIADAAVFLASPRAGWITGQTLTVDGGQVLR
jgi:3-oxoacyl-[acyl-carrier protein] reductase